MTRAPSHYRINSNGVTIIVQVTQSSDRVRPPHDSVERALGEVGDAWIFRILREAFFGVRRFDRFQKGIGAAPNIVADRLKKLVSFGILERRQYCDRPARFEYVLTDKGRDLYPAIVLLMQWGDRWLGDCDGAPLELLHKGCGQVSQPRLICDVCGQPVNAREMDWRSGGQSAAIE